MPSIAYAVANHVDLCYASAINWKTLLTQGKIDAYK